MTFTFDCWKTLLLGSWLERLRSALVIIMIFSLSSFILSLIPLELLNGFSTFLHPVLASLCTAFITIIKIGQ